MPSPTQHTGIALLRMDDSQVALFQQEVRLLELAVDMQRGDPPPNGVGWVQFRQRRHPVYALSAELESVATVPEGRPICVVLEAEGRIFGLLCNEVRLAEAGDLLFHELPPVMTIPGTPFDRVAVYGGGLVCGSSAALLMAALPAEAIPEST